MPTKGQVTYPKRKIKKEIPTVGIPAPVRVSMYDIVQENFKRVNRGTYLNRIIYVGEHCFKRDQQDELLDFYASTITAVDHSVALERLTGFLLIYTKYIVHLVEGPERGIHRHLKNYLNNEKYKEYIGVNKLLIHVSHLRKRFVETWKYYYGTPSKLLTDIDINSDLENSGRVIFNCIKKIYNLVLTFENDETEDEVSVYVPDAQQPDVESMQGSKIAPKDYRVSNISLRTMQPVGLDPYRATLPENEMLNFILQTTFTQELKKYFNCYGVVPQRNTYKDRVWPISSDFIPYDVFSKPYECVTELPREKKSEEKKKEELEVTFEDAETEEQ